MFQHSPSCFTSYPRAQTWVLLAATTGVTEEVATPQYRAGKQNM